MASLTDGVTPISLFAYLKEHFDSRFSPLACSKATLVHLSHTIEDMILAEHLPAMLFAGFQEHKHWRVEMERYQTLADVVNHVYVFVGGDAPEESCDSLVHVALHAGDPLRQEWFVCALNPLFSVVLCGQEAQVAHADEFKRQFTTFWTVEPEVVNHVIDLLEQVVANHYSERLEALREARRHFPATAPNPYLLSVLMHEFIQFEEQLRVSLAKQTKQYQVVSELTTDYVYTLEVQLDDSVISLWTTSAFQRITGYTAHELEAAGGWELLIHPDDLPSAYERKVRLFGGQEDIRELRVVTKSGEVRWIRDFARPTWDAHQQRVVQIVGAARDITEEKHKEMQRLQLEHQMQQTQKLESLGVLAGGIAHDFNNLLMSILGHAGLALMDLTGDMPARESLLQIEIAAQRAADLTQQLLAYVGKGRFVVQPMNLNVLIRELAQLLAASVPKHVTLRYRLAAHLPNVNGDATQLRQVVMNLVVNAAEAIPRTGGEVIVTTRVIWAERSFLNTCYLGADIAERWYVALEVSDSGVGVDVVALERIFEPFFTTKSTGRGLGLAAVLGIVRGHEGAINVSSTVGVGSTFTILLPTSEDAHTHSPAQHVQNVWRSSGTILVIDDEPEVRGVASRMLMRWGFEVLAAVDGYQGIDLFTQHATRIRCVLLDLTMPRLGGVETFHKLRELRPDVPIIMMSGYNEQEVSDLVVGDEQAAFLQKPFTLQALQTQLQRMMPES